jgi:hypothetical protein
MEKLKKTFGENLELFELAKLKRKYEGLGYKFIEKAYRIRNNEKFIIDAYAIHPVTKEEIIFQIKSIETIKKGDTERLLELREKYREIFPKARFVVVLAREPKQQKIVDSELNFLLLKFIEKNFLGKIRNIVKGLIQLESVTDITFDKLDFGNFTSISAAGNANLKFWIVQDEKEFRGESLSDGIPFYFNINIILNSKSTSNSRSRSTSKLKTRQKSKSIPIYKNINKMSKIDFDFSEFQDKENLQDIVLV